MPMDNAQRYRQDQDVLFAELEARLADGDRRYLRELFARADAVGLPVAAMKLRLALGTTTVEQIEQEIASAAHG